ncbi:relaxase/mobilization nuclease domain-containing protein [Gemella morbillorum]
MAYVKQLTIRSTLNKSINYITNKDKTDDGVLVYGLNCSINSKLAYKQMQLTKKRYDKKDGVLGYHFIQSFKPGEVDIETANKIGVEFAKSISKDKYEVVVATHVDKGHIHNHLVMNSVSFKTGEKYNSNKKQYEEIKEISNEITQKYGLSIIEPKAKKEKGKTYKEWAENKKGTSWKSLIKKEIDNLINNKQVGSLEELIEKLKEKGFEVKYKNVKYISFKAPGQQRFARGKTLGEEYTEEALIRRIEKINEIESIKYKNKPKKQWIDFDIYRAKFKKATLGNNIALTALIIKKMLFGFEKKPKLEWKKQRAIETLNRLEKALLILDSENINSEEEIKGRLEQCDKKYNEYQKGIEEINKLVIKIGKDSIKNNEKIKEGLVKLKDNVNINNKNREKYKELMDICRKINTKEYINEINNDEMDEFPNQNKEKNTEENKQKNKEKNNIER